MIDFVFKIILNTPLWVYGILLYLLFTGIKAIHKHVISLPQLFIFPVILIGLTYKAFLSSNNPALYLAYFIIGFIFGAVLASRKPFKVIKNNKSIEVPGDYSTLINSRILFCIRYTLSYLYITDLKLAYKYAYIDHMISFILLGLILGKAFYYSYNIYRN